MQLLLWNILRVVRHKVGWGPYLRKSQVIFMTTYKFLRWIHYEMDGRNSRYIGELLEWHLGDAGNLTRSE